MSNKTQNPGKTVRYRRKMSRFICLGRRGSLMQNRLGDKMFADVVILKSMLPAVLMTVSSVERALLVKLFHQNKGNASAAVGEFRRRKNLRRGPMSTNGIRAMIKRFEEKGKLYIYRKEETAVNESNRYLLMP
ncbi:hypothetical protein TNCV_2295071 [Trichonephila clavipes]|nr:hypothetical protein TNCV_2295071 [Trichonephila clavipes]